MWIDASVLFISALILCDIYIYIYIYIYIHTYMYTFVGNEGLINTLLSC